MYAMYRGSLAPKRFFRKLALVLKGVEWVGLVLQLEKFELLNEGIVGVIPDRVRPRRRNTSPLRHGDGVRKLGYLHV